MLAKYRAAELFDRLDGGLGRARGNDVDGGLQAFCTVAQQLDPIVHIMDATTQEQLSSSDGLLGRRRDPALVYPVLKTVEVDRSPSPL